jgi:CHAD domain-containing protein
MQHRIAERWGAVWRSIPAAIEGADSEGVHDVRVASRRLRAAMDVASECFPPSWYRPLHALAKQLTSELGAVRDRDVMIEHLVQERDAAPPGDRPGIDRLIARITRERDVARAQMVAFLQRVISSTAPADTIRRFGPAATPPWQITGHHEEAS